MKTDPTRRRRRSTGSIPPRSSRRLSGQEIEDTIDRLTDEDEVEVREASPEIDEDSCAERDSAITDEATLSNTEAVLREPSEDLENELEPE